MPAKSRFRTRALPARFPEARNRNDVAAPSVVDDNARPHASEKTSRHPTPPQLLARRVISPIAALPKQRRRLRPILGRAVEEQLPEHPARHGVALVASLLKHRPAPSEVAARSVDLGAHFVGSAAQLGSETARLLRILAAAGRIGEDILIFIARWLAGLARRLAFGPIFDWLDDVLAD